MECDKRGTPAQSCIFCRITAGELPASLVHQDDDWLVLMDIHPVRAGHVLVVPRSHRPHLAQFDARTRSALIDWADRIVRAQQVAGFAAGGANLLLNDGVAGDQHVPHLHLHCIPRRRGDGIRVVGGLIQRMFGKFGRAAPRARLDRQAAELRAALLVTAHTDLAAPDPRASGHAVPAGADQMHQ